MMSAQYVFLIVKINHRTLTTDPAPVSPRESKRGAVGVFKIPLLFDRESHFRSSSSKAAAAFVLVQQERRNVDDLQRTLTSAKDKYRDALGSLEAISNEIHRQRKANALPARTPGVGAESYADGGDGQTELPATSLGEGGPLVFFGFFLIWGFPSRNGSHLRRSSRRLYREDRCRRFSNGYVRWKRFEFR